MVSYRYQIDGLLDLYSEYLGRVNDTRAVVVTALEHEYIEKTLGDVLLLLLDGKDPWAIMEEPQSPQLEEVQ